jgi:hypothetical protein
MKPCRIFWYSFADLPLRQSPSQIVQKWQILGPDPLRSQELWDDRPDAEGRSLLRFSCAPLEFGKAVCATADEVLKQHGLAGYKERWAEHDFPVAELDLLKSYILRWEGNR